MCYTKGVEKSVLNELVLEGLTQRQMAKRLGCSQGTVKHWLKRHDLATLRARTEIRSQYPVSEVGEQGSQTYLECPKHGVGVFYFEEGTRYRCRACNTAGVLRRKRKLKSSLVEEFGGACVLCGYSRSVEALEFHHKNPASKSFNIGSLTSYSEARVREEAQKCVLLCSNCHREVEAGVTKGDW